MGAGAGKVADAATLALNGLRDRIKRGGAQLGGLRPLAMTPVLRNTQVMTPGGRRQIPIPRRIRWQSDHYVCTGAPSAGGIDHEC
jgi:hypothetical protein